MLGGLSALNSAHPESLDLEIDAHPLTITALYLPHLSATAALQAWDTAGAGSPLLVVGPRLHPSSAETLRARGLWYIDGAGNAYLRHQGGLLIDVRGRRSAVSAQPGTLGDGLHSDGPRNPFTPKRAQVVCVLLDAPQLVDAPLRAIAASAGVSVGMAKETMDTLRTTGFFEHLAPAAGWCAPMSCWTCGRLPIRGVWAGPTNSWSPVVISTRGPHPTDSQWRSAGNRPCPTKSAIPNH